MENCNKDDLINTDNLIKMFEETKERITKRANIETNLNVNSDFMNDNKIKDKFEEVLQSLGQFTLLNEIEKGSWEYIYGLKTTTFRKKGTDAIRIIKWRVESAQPLSRAFTVKRTINWKSNLIKRILILD